MNERPGALWYMLKWGLFSGYSVGLLFSPFLVEFYPPRGWEGIPITILLWIFFAGGIVAWLGIILGFINGILLNFLTAGISPQFITEDIHSRRKFIYPMVFFIPVIFLLHLFGEIDLTRWSETGFSRAELVNLIPLPVISGVLTYAAHRYLLKLEQWGKSLDLRKSKAKNDDYHRLTDDEEITDYTAHDSQTSIQESRS